MPKRLDAREFHKAAKAGRDEGALICKALVPERKEVNVEDRTIDFVLSTGAVDRDRDTIDPKGWDLANYRQNPVVLWAHDVRQPPIGRAVELSTANGALIARAQFADAETYPFADTVFRLYTGGYLNAVSVGFMPTEWEWSNDEERDYGIDFRAQELLEFSAVPVPSNPEALVQARAKGIDLAPVVEWAEKILDEGQSIILPRKLVERVRSAAEGKLHYALSPDEQDEILRGNLALIRGEKTAGQAGQDEAPAPGTTAAPDDTDEQARQAAEKEAAAKEARAAARKRRAAARLKLAGVPV